MPVDENMTPIRSGTKGRLYRRKDAQSPDMAQQMNYIGVESIDEYSKKIEKLGGKIKFPKMEIKGLGWWALAQDPEDNAFDILKYMKK